MLAGPFAGRMLSDLGADGVKVEPPDGDVTRQWGRVVAGLPGYYFQQNAGKRNISIKSPIAGLLRGKYGSWDNTTGFGRLSRLRADSGLRRQLRSMNFRIEAWSA